MSGHTPGPWAQHPSFPWIIKQDMRPIAEPAECVTVCNTTAHESSGFFPTPEEGRANARLIAAAPTLLDALQTLMKVHDEPAGFAGKYGRKLDELVEAQRVKVDHATALARAAIIQATGEQA